MKKTLTLIIALLTFSSCSTEEKDIPEYTNYNFSFIIHYDKGHGKNNDHECKLIFHGNELLKCKTTSPYETAADRAIELYHQYKEKLPGRICVEYELTEKAVNLGNGTFCFKDEERTRLLRKGDYTCFYNRTWKHMWWDDEPNI